MNRSALLILPSLALCILFFILPMAVSAVVGLWKIDFQDNAFVGFRNYAMALGDARFMGSLVNGLAYAVLITAGNFGIGIPLGLLVADLPKTLRKRIQTALYVPGLAAGAMIAALWIWVLHPFSGPLAGIVNVWANRWTAIAAISVVCIAAAASGNAVIISVLAASIGGDVREAARIDGAREGQIRWRIILPGISKILAAMVILSMIGATQIWETIQLISRARPQGASGSPVWQIYDTGFAQVKYGLASAETAIYLAVFGLIMLAVRRVKR